MAMYNLMFGQSTAADLVLATLGLSQGDFGRFRDVWINPDKIAVYTRCGGGNRRDYQHVFDRLKVHPQYSHDEDDSFDSTYATIYFDFPAGHAEALKGLANEEPLTGDQRWSTLFKNMEKTE